MTTGACSPPHLTCLGLCSMAAWKLNGPICAMYHQRCRKNIHKPTPVPPETVFEANWYLCVFQSLFFLVFLSTWGSLHLISFHLFFSEYYMSWSSGTWKTYYRGWHRNYEYEYIAWWYGGDCHVVAQHTSCGPVNKTSQPGLSHHPVNLKKDSKWPEIQQSCMYLTLHFKGFD